MRTSVLPFGLAVMLCIAGCAGDDATSANDVVQSADGRSSADTLIALVATRARAEGSAFDGGFIDYRQFKRVRLSVDGRPWGTFELEEEKLEEAANYDGWVIQPARSDALVVASLGKELERTDEELDTIAEWVGLLEKHLAPGGHIAVIEELVLERADGTEVSVAPRSLVPFQIAQGDESAWLGEVVVDIDMAGGAR